MTFQKNDNSSSYDPSQLLLPTSNQRQHQDRYAFILLNQPIANRQRSIFQTLWKNATFRICADGGANRLLQGSDYDWLPFKPPSMDTSSEMNDDENQERRMPLPHSIRGDLDSVSDSTLEFFKSKGVPIEKVPSQYATDLQKCIQAVEDFEFESNKNPTFSESTPSSSPMSTSQENQELDLIIYGGLSGRLDQTAHTLHVLWQTAPDVIVGKGVEEPEGQSKDGRGGKLKKRKRSFVIGDGCLTWLLPPGNHLLKHDRSILGKTCGILPFGIGGYPISDSSGKSSTGVKVKTKGLEWDLDGSNPSSIGGFLSTSNHLAGDGTVQLECDYPIYWTVELKNPSEP